MEGSSPRWPLELITAFALVVSVSCLWSGKIGFKGSRYVATRTSDSSGFWLRMSVLAAMTSSLLYNSVR